MGLLEGGDYQSLANPVINGVIKIRRTKRGINKMTTKGDYGLLEKIRNKGEISLKGTLARIIINITKEGEISLEGT